MKNTIGNSVALTLFGESHGEMIGAVLDGMASGIPVDEEYIKSRLALRRPNGKNSTGRIEGDEFKIVSGVFRGCTTGTPICILIPNTNVKSSDYEGVKRLARPGHADYTAYCKYHGAEDYRGGGHFSGRLTAPIVAAGAIAISALKAKGIYIGTHISRLGGISDRAFCDFREDIAALEDMPFGVLDKGQALEMEEAIQAAKTEGDSLGGVLETAVIGLPAGVGEPWFDSLESLISHSLFSIPAVKGVEFGAGFAMAEGKGSEMNDSFRMEEGRVISLSNNNGGINGGISNGMPLVVRCCIKPTPSIFKPQSTVDFINGTDETLVINGRHDPAIAHRARGVADAAVALALCDALAMRYGTDWLRSETI